MESVERLIFVVPGLTKEILYVIVGVGVTVLIVVVIMGLCVIGACVKNRQAGRKAVAFMESNVS